MGEGPLVGWVTPWSKILSIRFHKQGLYGDDLNNSHATLQELQDP
jgi:hypothetical protein